MRPLAPIPENRLAELNAFKKEKWSGQEFQRFLCVWLRVEKNMSTAEIATIAGKSACTVRLIQKQFIKHGVQALTGLKKGGRNRYLLTPQEEKDFLLFFDLTAAKGGILVTNEIKEALEVRMGKKIHKTTVYRMLYRNGWRKISPRPSHPKRDKQAGEAFKKGALPGE